MLSGLLFPVFLFVPYPQESIELVSSQCGLGAFLVRHFGAAALASEGALLFLTMGIVGVGLWRLLPWGRAAMMLVSFLVGCSVVEQIIEFAVRTGSHDFVDLIPLILSGLSLYYFSRPKVKLVFNCNTDHSAMIEKL